MKNVENCGLIKVLMQNILKEKSCNTSKKTNLVINNDIDIKPDDILASKIDLLIKSNEDLTKRLNIIEKELIDLKNKNNVVINVNNLQINLIDFGKEDKTFLTTNQIKTIMKAGFNGVVKLIELIHFNLNKPEYNNIYISSKKNLNRSIMVYENGKWNLRDKSYITNLRDAGISFIEEQYEDLKERGLLDNITDKTLIRTIERFIAAMTDADNKQNINNNKKNVEKKRENN